MISFKQSPTDQPITLAMHLRSEVRSVPSQNLNGLGNFSASNRVLLHPELAASAPAVYDSMDDFYDLDFLLTDFTPPVLEEVFQELTTEKGRRYFMTVMEPGKVVRAESVEVIEVLGLPTDPTEKQAHCRGLAYSSGFYDAANRVLKLCTTGGGDSLLDLRGLDLTYVHNLAAIEQLWFEAREKSLNDFIDQVKEYCAEKEGKEAAAEFQEMVNKCPMEVLANFYSVEIWHMLVDLEDKVKEDFMKLPQCKRPEIIDPPPAACSIYPIPGPDWKASSSFTTAADHGGVKVFCVPDLNEPYVAEEAGKNSVDFAIDGEEEKANSKKRKAEAASGEGQAHVPKMPSFPAAFL